LEARLQKLRQKIQQPQLRELLDGILDHAELGAAFRQAPAAMRVHQPYLRGLWEHSVLVAEISCNIAALFPALDQDVLIAGALFHDLGKIYEYAYERSIAITTEGRLLGHIVMGVDLLSSQIAAIDDFPKELRVKLLHIIISHHGRYEWQSPRRPKSMEAVVVHYADAMEADLWQFSNAAAGNSGEEWSPYIKSLERYILLK
jgi:3'-5' exoribonuclease